MARPAASFISLIVLLFLLLNSYGCYRKSNTIRQRAFYYWKSDESNLQDSEVSYLYRLHSNRLYVKFFEVDHDPVLGLIPVAKTSLHIGYNYSDTLLKNAEIIPTIFVRNEALKSANSLVLDTLASNIIFLVDKYHRQVRPNGAYHELQIDCDWTASTKSQYFHLLQALKSRLHEKKLSCTLRLYPYKYSSKMGIPPVDRAMLMCYNLINPLTQEKKNSILDASELKSYLTRTSDYPVPLDVALPIYSWMQVYQYNRPAGILYRNNTQLLSIMKPVKPLWYEVMQDTVIDHLYLRRGDLIKYERGLEQISEALNLVKSHVTFDDRATLSFFHLDAQIIQNLPYEKLDSLYNYAAHR